MKDIFKPGELQQNTINIKKKPVVNISPKAKYNFSDNRLDPENNIKSSFVIAGNRKFISPKIIIFVLIIIFILLSFFIGYYLLNENNRGKSDTTFRTEEGKDDLEKFEENLDRIESSSKNLDSDTQEVDSPTIDFNVNL